MSRGDHDHRDKCAIAGIGATDFTKDSGVSELTLAIQASLAALGDAGLSPGDVDGMVRCEHDLVTPADLVTALGVTDLGYLSSVGPGGTSPAGMIGQAIGAILSGQATTVLVYRALNGRSGGRRSGSASSSQAAVGGAQSWDEFFLPYGLATPGQYFALLAQRHMVEYGTTREQLGRIAMTCRARANENPVAQMHDRPMSLDDYLASPMMSSPLRMLDFCLQTDGANAVVVTSTERARDLAQPPAIIRAVAQGVSPNGQGGMMYPALLRDSALHLSSREVAERLYRRAGLGPDDIDVAQLYDCFTITVLLQLEDYGFCSAGEGGKLVESGEVDLDGRIPINTAGGNLSEGYIQGLNHVVEGVRQMRGTSTAQIADADVCLVTSAPPISTSGLILTRA